jgi:hypothetical protein
MLLACSIAATDPRAADSAAACGPGSAARFTCWFEITIGG